MKRAPIALALALLCILTLLARAAGKPRPLQQLVDVYSGPLTLRAQLWRPQGSGRFPAVLFNHGSYGKDDPMAPGVPETIGRVFARHGYVFMWLHRRGIGLSSGRGVADGDQMARGQQADGIEGRNRVQLQLLEHDELNDAAAALARLRAFREVDASRIAASATHSEDR